MIKDYITKIFSLDLRSLALFRILLGGLIISDLILRALYLKDHYSDLGILPRGILIDRFLNTWTFSLHLINGQVYFQAFLFLLAGIIAVLLMLGYKTRLMTFLSWFLLVSLQNRNYMVLQGGDTVFRVLLFWSMFLPLGARYSIDYALSTNKDNFKNNNYFSMGSVALTIQIAIIYIFNSLTKTHNFWTKDYTALWYALQIDQMVLPVGKILRQFPALCKILTFSTLYIEFYLPFLLFVTFFKDKIRLFLILFFFTFHIGISMTLNVGLFSFICMAAWCAFLPALFWNTISSTKVQSIEIYYDKGCGFCKKMVLIIKTFLFHEKVKLKHLQENEQTKKIFELKNSWVVKTNEGEYLTRFNAFIYLVENSIFKFFTKLLKQKNINIMGEKIYIYISDNRKKFSKLTQYLNYKEYKVNSSKFTQIIVALLLVSVIVHNYSTLKSNTFKLPKAVKNLNLILRLSQNWKMFAPKPLLNDGWYNIVGKLKNGKEVSLFLDNKISWNKPENIQGMYPTQRWRKYMMNIAVKKHTKHRLYFGKWICRSWNAKNKGDNQLETFKIYFMLEKTQPDLTKVKIKKNSLWSHNCFAK